MGVVRGSDTGNDRISRNDLNHFTDSPKGVRREDNGHTPGFATAFGVDGGGSCDFIRAENLREGTRLSGVPSGLLKRDDRILRHTLQEVNFSACL